MGLKTGIFFNIDLLCINIYLADFSCALFVFMGYNFPSHAAEAHFITIDIEQDICGIMDYVQRCIRQ